MEIEELIPKGVQYLKDSGTLVNGIKIWGSPVTPWLFNWAFNRMRGDNIGRHWDLIPEDTDILITHGPPFRTLDKNIEEIHIGCKDLFLRIQDVKPKLHIFGHVHESYGVVEKHGMTFINASVLNEKYEIVNQPISFQW